MMYNPIFESSARRRMRTAKTPMILTAYLLAVLLFSLSQLSGLFRGVTTGQMRRSTEWYIWLTALELFLIVLVAPALSAGSIAGERERQTFDLLLVTGVGVRKIIIGKLMESFAFLALLILMSAPVMALAFATSGVTLGQIMINIFWLLLISLEALSVGMLLSVLCRRSLTAIIGAYMAVFLLGGLSWALAKHGPLAAAYTYQSLRLLEETPTWQVLLGMPLPIFFNPAVGLVTMLAHQTGILHNTMQNTLRLQDIYSAAKIAGFGAVSGVCFAASCLSTAAMTALSVLVLHMQSGTAAGRRQK